MRLNVKSIDPKEEANSNGELAFVNGTQRFVIIKTFLEHDNITQLKFGQTYVFMLKITNFGVVKSRKNFANFF